MILERILALYDAADDGPLDTIAAYTKTRLANCLPEAPEADRLAIVAEGKALVDQVKAMRKRRRPSKGNPSASSVGRCLAQQEMLRHPKLTHPEPSSVRAAWVFEDGDLHAADLKHKVKLAFPGVSGLAEELFYAPVEVTLEEGRTLYGKIKHDIVWGTIADDFLPPKVQPGEGGAPDRIRLAPRHPNDSTRPKPLGFVLDLKRRTLWLPMYIDNIARYSQDRAAVIEVKSMSRFSFRRALMGEFDESNRMQLALIHRATGLPSVWMIKAKDTSHVLEVAFVPGLDKTRVEISKTNGQVETYFVPQPGVVVTPDGAVHPRLVEGEDWDAGRAWIPMDDALLKKAGERAKRVLLFHADKNPANVNQWDREFGPDFKCSTCQGTGTQTLAKTTKLPLKNGAKPCEDCAGAGLLEEATLPAFPCGYCATVAHCWAAAQPRLEITSRPVYYIGRANFLASGIQIRSAGDELVLAPTHVAEDDGLTPA